MIRRFDRRFDDTINDLKEKKLYFHDSMIRRFDRRFEGKIFFFYDSWINDDLRILSITKYTKYTNTQDTKYTKYPKDPKCYLGYLV